MRPLARWTMGKVSKRGWEVLSESIRLFPKVYPEFDLIICYNNLTSEERLYLELFDVPLYPQKREQAEFPFKESVTPETKDFAWKLIPTRLRPDGHELWIDNDIVIRKRIPQIEDWLNSNEMGIISFGYNADYGRFSRAITETCCAGFFGLPPLFDFQAEILRYCGTTPLYGFDEQGLVSVIVCNMKQHIVIPVDHLDMTGVWCPPWRARKMGRIPNLHFARANQENEVKHLAWTYYKIMTMP